MKSIRYAAVLIVFVIAGCSACRTGQTEGGTDNKDEPSTESDASDDESGPSAAELAAQRVETARLLAMPGEPLRPEIMQGFALPLYAELPGLNYEQMLAEIRQSGASHVSIVVSWDQRTIYANTIRPNPEKSPSDDRVSEVIESAHSQGLKVMLFPIIHVKLRNTGEWRGKMAPENLDRWKQEYSDFVLHYAEIAARNGVEIYSVGSELGTLEFEEEFWRGLIAQTRSRFDGKLLYSANWDHYTKPAFWDELDYIGVSSYFEIAEERDESVWEMIERWKRFRSEMLGFARAQGKPLIMTEVGYPSMATAATEPWDYTKDGAPDGNAQLAAFRALSQTWTLTDEDAELFAGLYIWHAWGPGGPTDDSYSLWGKPAARFVEQWYSLD